MAKVSFNVDAYTARLIGRENVAKLNGAVLELVKNTYDADASVCFLYYDESMQELYIGDNGCGMTPEIIMRHWMTIGRSTKKTSYVSKGGRIQTGAKGIGRFALDRIADRCIMLTATNDNRFIWRVDWRDFEKESAITEVTADLDDTDISFSTFTNQMKNSDLIKLIADQFDEHGTIFRLSMLRDKWGQKLISDIKNELTTLIPGELSQSFNIYLFDNSTSIEDAAVLHSDEGFSYDYKIEFAVSEDGRTNVKLWREEFDFGSSFEHVMEAASFSKEDRAFFTGTPINYDTTLSEIITKDKDKLNNTIGAFSGKLYFAKLQVPKNEQKKFYYKTVIDRSDFREAFGGIKLYRDQFRVRPYGDPHTSNYDWLQLSSRKNRSPAAVSHPHGAWRVRGDQMLGSVYISRVNITLPDQANREGIIETPEFGMLKDFLVGIIQLFERDRQYVCRKLDELYNRETEAEKYRQEIEKKAEAENKHKEESSEKAQGTVPPALMIEASKAQKVIEDKEETIRNLEDENRLLRVLATTGIAINSYIHEFKEQTHKLNMKIVMAKEALEYDKDYEEAINQIRLADQIRGSFTSWFRITIESVRRDKRTLKNVNLKAFISQLCDSWKQVLSGKEIHIIDEYPDNEVTYRCFPYEIEIILNNLITNSATILRDLNNEERKEIRITLLDQQGNIVLAYSDNGPGLTSAYKNNPDLILEPFESNKMNELGELVGTGMGMWLIKRTVSDYNGSIDLSQNRSELKGFYCKIILPKKA